MSDPEAHRGVSLVNNCMLQEELLMDKDFFKEQYEDLLELVNCLKVGVYITDGEGNTLIVNDESCKTGSLTREEVTGKNMRDLERLGFVKESISLKVLRSMKEEYMIQDLGDGGKVFVTGQPVIKDGEVKFVICTERDITEMESLKNILREKEQTTKHYEEEIEYLKSKTISMLGDVVAADLQSRIVVERLLRVSALDTTILLTGESGVGKEVFANMIYKHSNRVGKPFIKVNCAAIPDNLLESEMIGYEKGAITGADKHGKRGYFELAHTGTLFLDEIGELPIHLQSKLLRVLQEREVTPVGGHSPIPLDIRLIAATKIDLLKAVEKGTFREDLYYRLNVMPVEIPPLRRRPHDIDALALSFVAALNKQYRMDKHLAVDAMEILRKYEWPGNVRELQNVIERSMVSFDGNEISKFQIEKLLYPKSDKEYVGVSQLPEGFTMEEQLAYYEGGILQEALSRYGSASKAAQALGLNKSTMSRRMKKYKL